MEENIDELAKVQARRTKLLEDREKKVAEKRQKLFEGSKMQTFIEKAVDESKYDDLKGNVPELECQIFNLVDSAPNKIEEDKILKPILDKIQALNQNSGSDTDNAKSEEAMCKQYLRDITNYSTDTLNEDYTLVLEQLLVTYAKEALKDVLAKGNLETLVPALMEQAQKQKRLSCYLKSSYN